MQFTARGSAAIRAGRVTVTFRNWRRPHAKVGNVYRLRGGGAVCVTGIESVRLGDVSAADAVRAGFADPGELAAFLKLEANAEVTRVDFDALAEAPPRQAPVLALEDALTRLAATDRRSAKPWTEEALVLIEAHPATRAADLAATAGMETAKFKSNVRRLKALGLTQSLEVGYRLTDLGRAVAAALRTGE
jgi:hypothetical protein